MKIQMINPSKLKIIFNLDDDTIENGIAEIISSNEKSCTIRINKTKMLQLECRDRNTNKLLCYKTIYGVRKWLNGYRKKKQ